MYTAMHGVGYGYVKELLEHFALPAVTPVEVQRLPDPTFPTVAFPNPEEKGALTIAMKEADARGLSLVMATDPDADRFICCEKEREGVRMRSGTCSKGMRSERSSGITCVRTAMDRRGAW